MQIPITRVVIDQEEVQAVQQTLESGWLVQGPSVKRFEAAFAAFTGASHAIATTSCTTALHLALQVLGIGPGDEVIVPAFTWVATANVVEYVGAKPVFCDVDPVTFNLDTTLLPTLVSPRTRAILPVHLFGLPAEMDAVNRVATENQLYVVEDAACGFGAFYRGVHVGTLGNLGCFSFHPRKAITTGEGGMIVTNEDGLDARCRSLRDHGASMSDLQRHHSRGGFLLPDFNVLGFNYRMTDLQAAVGVAQMDKAQRVLDARRARALRYNNALRDMEWLKAPAVPHDVVHGYQSYVCLFDLGEGLEATNAARNRYMLALEDRGIATRQGTHSVVNLGYYREKYGLVYGSFPGARRAEGCSITLPLYAQMTDEEQDYVIDGLRQCRETL